MLLKTVVYEDSRDEVMDELNKVIGFFEAKDIILRISESINNGIHFVKIFCDDSNFNESVNNKFDFYMANVLYKIVVNEYCLDEINNYLNETYFFLKYEDIKEIASKSYKILSGEDKELDEDKIYCFNKTNDIIDKIQECLKETNEININGFITFRMKELKNDLESVVNKIAEKYMVEKEYDEFIKLLKYFVDVQESKIDEINIIIKEDGDYIIRDKDNKDMLEEIMTDLTDSKYNGNVSKEDLIISGLITYSPESIIIHHCDNCTNKEIIETIQKVFEDRVKFCDKCSKCSEIKTTLKV